MFYVDFFVALTAIASAAIFPPPDTRTSGTSSDTRPDNVCTTGYQSHVRPQKQRAGNTSEHEFNGQLSEGRRRGKWRSKRHLGLFEGRKMFVVTKVVYDSRVRELVAIAHGARNVDKFLKQYYEMLVSFTDRRFQSLRDQGIDIYFRGLKEMEYINLEAIPGMNTIPHYQSAENMRWTTCSELTLHFFQQSIRDWTKFDHIILLTGYHLIDRNGQPYIAGQSLMSSMCTRKSTSIVKFGFRYSELLTVAHEIMHTFGVNHDGDMSRAESAGCKAGQNFVMERETMSPYDPATSENFGKFSPCTTLMLRIFLRSLRKSKILKGCLSRTTDTVRRPKQNYEYGFSVTYNEQCRRLSLLNSQLHPSVTIVKSTICNEGLPCLVMVPQSARLVRPLFGRLMPYPGTVCDGERTKWCDEKRCVPIRRLPKQRFQSNKH